MTLSTQAPIPPRRHARPATRFRHASGGSVAIVFAVAAVAMLGMVGGAVDYSRLTAARAKLQAATDAAALAVAATVKSNTTPDARASLAMATVKAQFQIAPPTTTLTEPAGQYVVAANADVPLTFMKAVGRPTAKIAVQSTSVSVGGSGATEIALALDNTGSMKNVIGDLRSAASTFVNTVFASGGTNIKVSVVPYVAAVNPGLTDMAMVDTTKVNMWHADFLRSALIFPDASCTLSFGSGSSGGSVGGSSSGDVGGSALDLIELLNPFRRHARALFGPAQAAAADVTANTIPPYTVSPVTSPTTGKSFQMPAGFKIWEKQSSSVDGDCDWLRNPWTVSHYELYKRIKKTDGAFASWKGCVEARPTADEMRYMRDTVGWAVSNVDDYDVKELPPTAANPYTLFVPYFWPDEPDYDHTTGKYTAPGVYSSAVGGYHNNYMTDTGPPAGWGWKLPLTNPEVFGHSIFKYDGTTPAVIKETWPNTSGPNASCPDPVQRLTNNQTTLLNKIANLGYWYNGGTVISEGLMWAWRTLSPNAPYSDGAAYNTAGNTKVIVLMTDGVNGLADNGGSNDSDNKSDYSAYGYMGSTRMWSADRRRTYDDVSAFLDTRTREACWNAKQQGIRIYTVLFNHGTMTSTQVANSVSLLQQCASENAFFYQASDLKSLNDAFSSIAGGIGSGAVRLVK
jgi:Flp pilus assembly protein TadG